MSLKKLTSEVLAAPHGFFTRLGGVSRGVFAGLNCGLGSSDLREDVLANRARVALEMGVPGAQLIGLHQVHSARAVTVCAPWEVPPQADGLVTNTPGLALCVLSADCMPVLFEDTHAGVIGAAHAGWRGALDGVLEATIEAMETLGAQAGNIRAAIGPAISKSAYEVGPDLKQQHVEADPQSAEFFTSGMGDRLMFDLPGYGLHRLARRGVAQAAWTGHCTYSDPAHFFSYRRSVHGKVSDYGRLISAIRLPHS